MYYCDYFRNDKCFYDEEIPPCCPFAYNDYMNRMPPPMAPPMPPQTGHQGSGAPSNQGLPPGPPPTAVPTKHAQATGGAQAYAVEQGTIRRCMHRYMYIWPRRGHGFWAWLTYVGRRSVSGYKWNGYRWMYFGMDLREIDSFECY